VPDSRAAFEPFQVGDYTCIERLGAGGMAEVFLAEQAGLSGFKKRVVVKRILPHLVEDEVFVEMFQREARVAAGLNHGNIAQILDLGEERGSYFIVMEHVDGLTLYQLARRAWTAQRSLPMDLVLPAIADAARGLHHAHVHRNPDGEAAPIVHRDISPDNLMINIEGVTKIVDFGIAKASRQKSVTRTGELKGKIPFMSPEQLLAQGLDGRSDLYSLGVTMYWLLCGRRPFAHDSDLILMQTIIGQAAPRVASMNPSISNDVDEIVASLLAKAPDERPATGEELAEELLRLVPASRAQTARFVREARELPKPRRGGGTGSVPAAAPSELPAPDVLYASGPNPFAPASTTFAEETAAFAEDTTIEVSAQGSATDVAATSPPATSPPATSPPATLVEPPETSAAVRETRQRRALGGAAIAAAAVLIAGVLVFLLVDEEPSSLEPPAAEPAATVVTAAKPVAPEPTPAPATPPPTEEPAAPTPAASSAPPAEAPSEQPAASVEESAETPPTDEAPKPSDTPDPAAGADAPPPPAPSAASKTDRPTTAARTTRGTRHLKVKAPAHVRVETLQRKRLGKGNGTIEVAASTKRVAFVDPTTGLRVTVPASDVLDFHALPTGMLDVRVFPYATVFLGKKRLGRTPLIPHRVPAGRYKVRAESEGKQTTRTVDVKADGTTRVKIDMREVK
jgi:serine/threonine-protein kinase